MTDAVTNGFSRISFPDLYCAALHGAGVRRLRDDVRCDGHRVIKTGSQCETVFSEAVLDGFSLYRLASRLYNPDWRTGLANSRCFYCRAFSFPKAALIGQRAAIAFDVSLVNRQ